MKLKFAALLLALLPAWSTAAPTPPAADCPAPLRTIAQPNRACMNSWLASLFNDLGCPIDFEHAGTTWPRRIQLLFDGQVEVLFGLSDTPERRAFVQFSQPLVRNRTLLMAPIGQPRWRELRQWCDSTMRQAHILVPGRGYFGQRLENLRNGDQCANNVTLTALGNDQSMKMLLAGRADLAVVTETWWVDNIDQLSDKFYLLDLVVWQEDLGIATHNLPPAFLARLDALIGRRVQQDDIPCGMQPPLITP